MHHFENSWQWPYTISNPLNPNDPSDALHNHQHPFIEQDRGKAEVDTDLSHYFKVEIIIRDGLTLETGGVSVKLDHYKVSDVTYQTKSPSQNHVIQFGQYWSKGYNSTVNGCINYYPYPDEKVCKSNTIGIHNLKIEQRINL